MSSTFKNLWTKIRAFLAFYVIGTIGLIKQTFVWSSLRGAQPPASLLPQGKRRPLALITGGTKGIGFELARLLAQDGFDLILVARDKRDGASAVDRLTKTIPDCTVEFQSVDLSSLNEVKQFIDGLKQRRKKLNLLINNAALMMTPYKLVDGVEWQWATNVVALIVLCESLIDLLERGAKEDGLGRIVNVSSSAQFAQKLTINYIMNRPNADEYSSHLAYANTKVAVTVYSEDLQKSLLENHSQVQVVSMHPGVIVTDLYKYVNPVMTTLTRPMSRSALEAAYDIRFLCYEKITPGKYYENGRVTAMSFVNSDIRRAFKSYVESLNRRFSK